jgi:hypothetical protein
MEVLQTSALPLGDGADRNAQLCPRGIQPRMIPRSTASGGAQSDRHEQRAKAARLRAFSASAVHPAIARLEFLRATADGAGNGIRTRDFDLGKVALYH